MINDGPEAKPTHSFQKIPQYPQEIQKIKSTVMRFFSPQTMAESICKNYYSKLKKEAYPFGPDRKPYREEIDAWSELMKKYSGEETAELARIRTNESRLEREMKLFEKLGNLGLILCGGAVTSVFTDSVTKDLDFYLEDKNKLDEAVIYLSQYFDMETPFVSSNAITFKRRGVGKRVWSLQLITKFIGNPDKIFSQFDFTVTQAAYHFKEDKLYFGERFFVDIGKKRLVYLGKSSFPICAMYRTLKYQKRGYKLPGSTVMHIALHILQLDIKTYKDLKAHLMGIDTMYLMNLFDQSKVGSFKEDAPVDYGVFLDRAFSAMGLSDLDEDEENES